jgi:hypothetical protein
MERNAANESSRQLLNLAHEHGYEVSATQLGRWHRAGLLPRPKQQAMGKAQGSQSLYPPGTGEQLLALCALRSHERRFSHLTWQLWWAGYPVDLQIIWRYVHEAAARLSKRVQWFVALKQPEQTRDGSTQELSERVLDFIEQLAAARLDYKPLRRVRKRVGKEHFPTFMRILVDVASGTFEGYDTAYDAGEVLAELRILAKGLGLDEIFIKDNANIEHYIGKITVPLLQDLSAWLRMLSWEQALPTATDFDLLQARDEMRMFLMGFERSIPLWQQMPRDYPVWSAALREIFLSLEVDDQAALLAIWMALRSTQSF